MKIKVSDYAPDGDGMASPKSMDNMLVISKPKVKNASQDKFDLLLRFKDPADNELYKISLRNLFYFPTFVPIMIACVAFVFACGDPQTYKNVQQGWALITAQVVIGFINGILFLSFICAQTVYYFEDWFSAAAKRISFFILYRFLYGRIEDIIIILNSFALGCRLLSITVGNQCSSCGQPYLIVTCEPDTVKVFPLHAVFLSFMIQLVLPIHLKSTHRHISLLSMFILGGFTLIAYFAGGYEFTIYSAFTIVFYILTMHEYERFRMTSFILGKEALIAEKTRQDKSKQDARDQLERRMNQALLQQILPAQVAKQLLSGNKVAPEEFEEVTIFFSDVVGFTNICAAVSPIQVVKMLNELYTVMDYCTSHFPLYKVETIGDAYMLVGGLPIRDPHHAEQIADFALIVSTAVQAVISPADGTPIRIRIGIHSGSVMAGVVGNLMPRYCLFGDTVNTASRMESNGEAGRIHCSEKTADILKATGKYIFTDRGPVEIKGKGTMNTFWLDKAMESNVNSNEVAIAKVEVMVQELLQSTDESEFVNTSGRGNENNENSPCNNNLVITTSNDSGGRGPLQLGPILEEGNNTEFSDISSSNNNNNNNPKGSAGNRQRLLSNGSAASDSSGKHNMNNSNNNTGNNSPALGNNNNFSSPRERAGSVTSTRNNSIHSNNPNALHSLRYNITHRLSDPTAAAHDLFSSSGAKILVVEDSAAQRKMLVQRLHKADPTWDVSQAISGEDALSKLQAARWRFDVVFVDENLSIDDGLFGHELVHLMRRQAQMSTSVIIACTSNPAKVTDELLNAGVDFVWPKPPPLPGVIKPKIDFLLAQRLKAFAQGEQARISNTQSNVSIHRSISSATDEKIGH